MWKETIVHYSRIMEKPKNWTSLEDFFHVLNEHVEYLVLRNFEELIEVGVNDDHPDIDLLCQDSKQLIQYSGSITRTGKQNDLIHQKILIDGKTVSLDVRHVGDGYYDESWEKEMLEKRHLFHNMFYVMDEMNYYYSLLYHALIQKKAMKPDYQSRLETMKDRLGISDPVEVNSLQKFMFEKGYLFTYPENPEGIANFRIVDKSMIKRDLRKQFNRQLHRLKRNIIKILKTK